MTNMKWTPKMEALAQEHSPPSNCRNCVRAHSRRMIKRAWERPGRKCSPR